MAIAVGLDIGQETITAVALNGRGSTVTLNRYASVPRAEIEGVGKNDDPIGFAQRVAAWLITENFPNSRIHLGIAGKDSIIRYSILPPMPPWRLKLIMQYEIAEVADKAGESLTADYTIVPVDNHEKGFSVLIALARDSAIEPTIAELCACRLDLTRSQPASVAVGDALRFMGDPEAKGYTVVANIGKTATDVAVLDGGQLVFARSMTSGGQLFTDRIAKRLNLSDREAEQCKLNRTGPDGESLAPILKTSMRQYGNMLKSTLNYMKGQLKIRGVIKPARLVVTGGSARLPGLVMTLGDMLDCPAEAWNPLESIDISGAPSSDQRAIEDFGFESGVACGLALRGLMKQAVQLDLLPNTIRKEREWLHRTRWLIIAAAVLLVQGLLSLGLAFYQNSAESSRQQTLTKVNAKKVKNRVIGHKKRVEDNESRERYLSALASRTRAGRQAQHVMEILARVVPSNMTLTSLEMEPAEGKARRKERGENELSNAPAVRFMVEGEVDNAQLRCEQQLAQLQDIIRKEPSIDNARVDPTSNTEEPRVRFRIIVMPKDSEG